VLTLIVCLVVIILFVGIAAKTGAKYNSGDWAKTDAMIILNFSIVVILVAIVLLFRTALNSDGWVFT
jgi:heme/copper-type cytochrome/quinol oxidase subunit 2